MRTGLVVARSPDRATSRVFEAPRLAGFRPKVSSSLLVPKLHLGTQLHWQLHCPPPAPIVGGALPLGGNSDTARPVLRRREVQLRGQVRSQVQLGNEWTGEI
jgi:hypothetical protein